MTVGAQKQKHFLWMQAIDNLVICKLLEKQIFDDKIAGFIFLGVLSGMKGQDGLMAGEQSVLIMQSPRNLLTSMSLLIGLALAAVVLNSSLQNHAWSHKNVLFGNGVNLRSDIS